MNTNTSPLESLQQCRKKLQDNGADQCELYFEKASNLKLEIKNTKLDHLNRSTDQGLSVRVLKNGRMGFAYTYDLSNESIDRCAATALSIAELMPKDEFHQLQDLDLSHYQEFNQVDLAGLGVPFERKLDFARLLEELTLKKDSRVKRVRKASLSETDYTSWIMDTSGDVVSHRQTLYGAQVLCVAEHDEQAETGYDLQYSCFFDQLKAEPIAAEASRSATEGLNAGKAPTMKCPAIFKNSVVAELIGFLSNSFSAENIDKNLSVFVNKKGKKLFSHYFTLIDDPLMALGIATSPFDGEGTPSKKKILVDQGVVGDPLLNLYYSRKWNVPNNGSASRSGVSSMPGIGTSNLYLQKGLKPFQELVSDADNGILITNLLGLHTANQVTGEFSVGASGVLIENGHLTRAVRGFAIAGNLIDILSQIVHVGSDLRFWGSTGAPSLLISELNVSGGV